MLQRPIPIPVEIKFEDGNLISESDEHGRITYVNRLFCQMTGYTREELIGQPHSIIRHPDMPKGCFEKMWKDIKYGERWEGYIKNLRKDGAYFWVIVSVAPKYDANGKLCGFIALRKPPGNITLEEIRIRYAQMIESEQCARSNQEDSN